MLKTASSSSSDNVAVQQDLVYHSSDTCRCLYSGQHALFRQCRFCKVRPQGSRRAAITVQIKWPRWY
jgi:hypothetical protein